MTTDVEEFLGVSLSAWTALAAWVTVLIYTALLVYAIKQVAEARRSREEQSRPFVVVDFDPNWLTYIVVNNIGRTAARNVTLIFDPPLASTLTEPWPWAESTALTSGVPLLPPHRELRLLFDALNQRFASELPMTYKVTVQYSGPPGSKADYKDEYVLDLNVFRGMTPPPAGVPEIAKHIEELRKVLKSWTHGISGLKVFTIDAEQHEKRTDAAIKRQIAAQRREQARQDKPAGEHPVSSEATAKPRKRTPKSSSTEAKAGEHQPPP